MALLLAALITSGCSSDDTTITTSADESALVRAIQACDTIASAEAIVAQSVGLNFRETDFVLTDGNNNPIPDCTELTRSGKAVNQKCKNK